MTDDLREKVQLAVEAVTGDPFHDGAADAAIRAVLTYWTENGPTSIMINAAHDTESASPTLNLQAMMRAARAERGR